MAIVLILGRLLWQQLRQSIWLLAMWVIVWLVISVGIRWWFYGGSRATSVWTVVTAGVGALLGSCVFAADQAGQSYRFFAEHAAPPRIVWLSRQAMGIAALSLGAWLIWMTSPILHRDSMQLLFSKTGFSLSEMVTPSSVVYSLLGIWLFALVAFAAGQWASMFIGSPILATVCGVALAAVLVGWLTMVELMRLPRWLFFAPLPIGLVVATWLRSADWITENRSWPTRMKAAATTLAPFAAIALITPLTRVWQVYPISVSCGDFDIVAHCTPAGLATAQLYAKASQAWSSDEIHDNQEAMSHLLQASQAEECCFADPGKLNQLVWITHLPEMLRLVVESGTSLEKDGKLDEALDRYLAALRILSHWNDLSLDISDSDRRTMLESVFLAIGQWAARSDQSPERLFGAIRRLEAIGPSWLRGDENLNWLYVIGQRCISDDRDACEVFLGHAKQPNLTAQLFWQRYMPGEVQRNRRVLGQFYAASRQRLLLVFTAASNGSGIAAYTSPPTH